jgi:hypothetical protein
MAGFTIKNLDNRSTSFIENIQRNIRMLSIAGMRWDEKVIKQSKAVGISEATEDTLYSMYLNQQSQLGSDIGQHEFIAFFDKEYPTRRDFLRRFAMNGEIEHVLEVIADESIIFDDNNYFAYPNTKNLKAVLKPDKAKQIVDDLNESFKQVYYAFNFNNSHDGWHYLKKFLIDGFLAFEIIYDGEGADDAKNILGFKELDPISLEPEMRKDDKDNEFRVWIQYKGDSEKERVLLDANLIYISWARGNFISRLSYVERLVRSFNMLRTLENSRIIWNVINSQYRMKIIVPIGTQSEVKSRTRLSELRGMYKEDVTIDYQSGEISINGQPNFSYAKTYIFPSKDGVQTEIDSFAPQGYDLKDTEALQYFWKRFIVETKVPNSRFNVTGGNEGGEANWTSGGDGIAREEMRFSYFINRIRSIFQEILLKPTWIQFCLKHNEFVKDKMLKGSIGLLFTEENLFTIAKEREIAAKGADTVATLMNVKSPTVNPDGTPGEESYFDPKFLVEKYMQFNEFDLKLNEKYKKERRDQLVRIQYAYKRMGVGEQGTEAGGFGPEPGLGGFGPEPGLGGEPGSFGEEAPPTEAPATPEGPEAPLV